MSETASLLMYGAPMALLMLWYVRRGKQKHGRSVMVRDESIEAGLTEPASLHPVIDPTRCIGCEACIKACPEMPGHQVIGMIHGKAELISPTECIGHGACLANCPADAITLVFGTERRGVEIPNVGPDFQTNVPGIYIAGELGGMGLIRNAIEQGSQAIKSISESRDTTPDDCLDVLIVGAGPAGFAASLGAMDLGLTCKTIEQDALGGAVAHYPRGKLVMTAPAILPIVGKFRFGETTKEALLKFWRGVEEETGVQINYGERLESVTKTDGIFSATTSKGEVRARAILLAIGRRGSPRKLDVDGENSPKVAYQLIDPDEYKGRHTLIVGGGDSALEAACSIADVDGAVVTVSYRAEAFSRAKPKNRERIAQAVAAGQLEVILQSTVERIDANSVSIRQQEDVVEIANDAVIINAGGILPTAFLKGLGIDVATKFGTT
jgi:thioredoxin reductase (NADPH)